MQVGHACIEAGNKFDQPSSPLFLVVLQVKNQNELMEAVERIERNGVKSTTFYEPDDDLGYTAACTEPVTGERRKLFRRYQTWK